MDDEEYIEDYSTEYTKTLLDGFDSWNDEAKASIVEEINISHRIHDDFDKVIEDIGDDVVCWADDSPYGKYKDTL